MINDEIAASPSRGAAEKQAYDSCYYCGRPVDRCGVLCKDCDRVRHLQKRNLSQRRLR